MVILQNQVMLDVVCFGLVQAQTAVFCAGVLEVLSTELKESKVSNLKTGIQVLGYISSTSDPINIQAFDHLLTFLTHPYPQVSKSSCIRETLKTSE